MQAEGAEGEGALVVPEGDLNTPEECGQLDRRLQAMLAAGARTVVLDGSRVGHISGAGLRVLLRAGRRLGRVEGRLILCGLTKTVRNALAVSALDREFAVVSTREEALARASSGPATPPAAGRAKAEETPSPAREALASCANAVLAALPAAAAARAGVAGVGPSPAAPGPDVSLDALADAVVSAVRARPSGGPAGQRSPGPPSS